MKKFLSVIAAVMILCLLFTSCSSKSTDEQLTMDDITASTPVFECAGKTITYDEYAYMLLSYKATYEYYYGEDFWTTTDGEAMEVYLRSYTDSYLQETCGLLYWADELGITLDEDDEATIEESYQSAIDNYGSEEALLEAMEGASCTKDLYMRLIRENVLINKLQSYVEENLIEWTEDDLAAWADENGYIRVQHILIKNDDGDDADANLELAEELQKRAADGEDFLSLVEEYSEDSEEYFESGYTFNEDNDYIEAFADAALALEIGEVSDVVTVDDWYTGYHIIKRVDLDLDQLQDEFLQKKFYDLYDKALDGHLDITYPGGFDNIAFDDIVFKAE